MLKRCVGVFLCLATVCTRSFLAFCWASVHDNWYRLLTALESNHRDCVMLREALYWNAESFVGLMMPSPPSRIGSAISLCSLSLSELLTC